MRAHLGKLDIDQVISGCRLNGFRQVRSTKLGASGMDPSLP